jgi:hypothetical protein
MKGGFESDFGGKIKGKNSRKTVGLARVFLRKNRPPKGLFFAIKGLHVAAGAPLAGQRVGTGEAGPRKWGI